MGVRSWHSKENVKTNPNQSAKDAEPRGARPPQLDAHAIRVMVRGLFGHKVEAFDFAYTFTNENYESVPAEHFKPDDFPELQSSAQPIFRKHSSLRVGSVRMIGWLHHVLDFPHIQTRPLHPGTYYKM